MIEGRDLKAMSVDELVDLFAEIGVAQGQASEEGILPPEEPSVQPIIEAAKKKFDKLYGEMEAVDQELRVRGLDARLALTRLYDHPDMQVTLQAARYTLGVAPEVARQVIQWVANSKWPPQYFDARMTLVNLDNGVFKPT
jgi:hypothetical protein